MPASPDLSRRVAAAINQTLWTDEPILPADRRALAAAAEKAGVFSRLPKKWQQWVRAAEALPAAPR